MTEDAVRNESVTGYVLSRYVLSPLRTDSESVTAPLRTTFCMCVTDSPFRTTFCTPPSHHPRRRGPHGRSAADVMCVPRMRFWRPGGISRHSFTLSGISWCQSTDLMEYIKMDQVPFSFMKVEPSHDGPDYSRLTEPEPSPRSGRAVPTRTHLCWPPGPK